MNLEERNSFLAKTRVGYLTTLRGNGAPMTTPIWFDWNGEVLQIFTDSHSAKVTHIENDARVTMVAANEVGEKEGWIAFDGNAVLEREVDFAFIERLADRYWDMSEPTHRETVAAWRMGGSFCLIRLRPERIRSYGG